ncbi:uncharacterized protein B0H64DRAFT_445008 [Chaetomium fimeti]|uniref:Transmembrane protein n=1 Tax=Chaetomium fimeti TaxID=1854472 RepID=A0AAE0HCB5_9PEZI|nr:hypothetical protein B0H64DRAFT_445008 [Chaetomium fimeti]
MVHSPARGISHVLAAARSFQSSRDQKSGGAQSPKTLLHFFLQALGLPMDNPQVSARVSPIADADAPSDPQLREAYEATQEGYRRMKEQTRRLLQNRPQSWRHLLGLLCGLHFSILFGRLAGGLVFSGLHFTQLNVLSAAAVALALATRITWGALFASPYSFLGYRRPGVHYRWAVRLVSLVTTIPALILHLAMIRAASQVRTALNVDLVHTILQLVLLALNVDLVHTILQLVLLLPAMSLYAWMVRRFLLRQNDEHYEPTASPSPHEETMNARVAGTGHLSSGLDSSTSKAKGSIYAPLGVFLLCAYAIKRFIHTSFFARITMPPPHPWVLTSSLLGRPIIRNSEDGSIAVEDPRFRVPIRHRDYITRYNETASGCDGYWGHRGRERTTDFRIRPAFYRFAFLGWAFYFFAKGFLCIFHVNYPTHAYDGELKRPDLTIPDQERQMRILYLKWKLMMATAPLAVLVVIYTGFCALKLFGMWTDAIMRYAPPREPTQPERQIQL